MSSTACGHNDELLALGAMQLLSPEEQARLDERVRTCPACRKRLQEYRALADAMPRLMMPEMAPSRAITVEAPPTLNGKSPHISLPLSIGNGWETPETHYAPIPEPLSSSRLEYRPLSQRLASMVSGLAAVVLLIGLIGGFWLLALARTPGGSTPLNPFETPQPTTLISNPCVSGTAKQQGPTCGLVLLDSSTLPAQLVEADPTTGQELAALPPLPVGNATLASLSADHRTLAMGITPYQSSDPTFLQMVSLNPWRLGAKATVQLDQGASLQNLAMAPDGSGVYAVLVSANASQATLRYYAYDRAHDRLTSRWTAPLPFAPCDANSFALSSDGKTAYLFSAATTPYPQLDAISLGASGPGGMYPYPLPSIAPEGQVPDPNAAYNPNAPLPSIYQPAVIFAPAQNKLYLIHAEAKAPQNDVLVVIDLMGTYMSIDGNDIPITEAGQALAAMDRTLQPQQATRPAKGQPYYGRSEQGTVSSEGRWIYLTGTTYTPASSGGAQAAGMGVLKIDTQTGRVVGHWLKGNTYSALTVSPDGNTLYVFGDPYTGQNNPDISDLLALDTLQGTIASPFTSFTSGAFIFALR